VSEREKYEHAEETIANLEKNRGEIIQELIEELNSITSVRTECLLLANYVDNTLKDIMVMMMVSNKARKIARNTIVAILEEKKLVSNEMANDIGKIFEIRDLFGHRMKISEAEKMTGELIETMFVVSKLKEEKKDWDKKDVSGKISDIALKLVQELNSIYSNIKAGVD